MVGHTNFTENVKMQQLSCCDHIIRVAANGHFILAHDKVEDGLLMLQVRCEG